MNYDILYISTKTQNMHETAIPMGKMLHTCLAIHGRCKFIIFLRGQTPSLSAPTLILSLMEHFEGKAKNTVKYSVKSTFCRSIQINCNWLPGNPQPSPYIYIYIHTFYINCMRILDQFATKETAYQESDCFSASSHMDVSKPKP